MKKHIAEDLPARKHPQAQLSQSNKPERKDSGRDGDDKGGEKTPEQRIRQAVYDIRYRARRENLPLRSAYSQYMQNSSMGEQEKAEVRAKLFGKEGGGMQAEDFTNYMKDSASNAVSKALYKVFLEKNEEVIDEEYIEELKRGYIKKQISDVEKDAGKKRYKVRVHDKQSGVTYVRYATREKISQLRAKGLEVEMTEYGTPYEGERERGEQTSAALGGGRAKKDYDKDGKVESPAKEYRGSVHNAIQRRKGGVPDGKDTSSVKESFLGEVAATANLPQTDASQQVNPDSNSTQIDFTTKKNKIVVNPTDNSQTKLMSHHEMEGDIIVENGYSKFLKKVHSLQEKAESEQQQKLFGLALSVKRGKTPRSEVSAEVLKIVDTMSEKKIRDFAKTKHEGIPKQKVQKEETECGSEKENKVDRRPLETAINLAKNKARAMGAKNPLVMVTSEQTGPALPGENRPGTSKAPDGRPHLPGEKQTPIPKKSPKLQLASHDLEGELIDERRREEKGTPRKPRDRAFEIVAQSMGTGRAGVQPRGKKKVPGEKPPAAGERGSERRSPEQEVELRRERKKESDKMQSSRFD
jgi:hypothetical protein